MQVKPHFSPNYGILIYFTKKLVAYTQKSYAYYV